LLSLHPARRISEFLKLPGLFYKVPPFFSDEHIRAQGGAMTEQLKRFKWIVDVLTTHVGDKVRDALKRKGRLHS
jgi:hypothetical protein